MRTLVKRLATIGVSEFIVIFVLMAAFLGVVAMNSSVTFQQVILPPPPPVITTILGDPQLKAVLVIGTTTLTGQTVRVFAYSDPLYLETTADEDGRFYAVFTADVLPPGNHRFLAAVVLTADQTTDPSPTVAVNVADDYTVSVDRDGTDQLIQIGNTDETTSQLVRALIRTQAAGGASLEPLQVPRTNAQSTRALWIQTALLAIIILESAFLLLQRLRRKSNDGKTFYHLGTGFYRHPSGR